MFDVKARTARIVARAKTRALVQELDEFVRSDSEHFRRNIDDSDDSLKEPNYQSESDCDSSEEGSESYHLQRGRRVSKSMRRSLPKASKPSRGALKRRKLDLGPDENATASSKLKKTSKVTNTSSLKEKNDGTDLTEMQTSNACSSAEDTVNKASSFKNFLSKFKSGKENENPTVDKCSVERSFKDYISNPESSIAASKPQSEIKSSVIDGSFSVSQSAKMKSTPVAPSCPDSRIQEESAQLSSPVSATVSSAATPNSSLTKPITFEKSDASPSHTLAKSLQPSSVVFEKSSEPLIDGNNSFESSFKDFISNSKHGIAASNTEAEATSLFIDDSFSDLRIAKTTSTPVAPICTDSGIHEESTHLSSPVSATTSNVATPNSSLTKPASFEKSDTSPSIVKSAQPISVGPEEPASQINDPVSVFVAGTESRKNEKVKENSDGLQSGSSPVASVLGSSSTILETPSENNSSHIAASTTTVSQTGAHCTNLVDTAFEGISLSGEWVRDQLKKTQNGRNILKWFKDRGSLNSRKRTLLVQILIDYELDDDPSKGISSERFLAIAQAICKCFPSKIPSTYFSPRHRNKFNKVFRAKGKLYDKWINTRRSFRGENIIIGRRNLQSVDADELSDTEDSECTEVQMTWTKTRTEYPEAIPYFTATCRARIKEFLLKGPNRSIAEFLKKYPAYTTENGHLLIEQEFDTIYPGKGDNFLNNWRRVSTKIIEFAQDKLTYSTNFVRTLTSYKIDLTQKGENIRTINALNLLALLLPSMTVFRSWKVSRYESINAFLLCTPTSKDAATKLTLRNLRLQEFNIPVPPTPVIVGGTDCNVCIDDVVYPCGSPLAALDICCKLQILLQTDFPPDCQLQLMFVKAYLYGIEPDMAEEFQGICTLKNDLKL